MSYRPDRAAREPRAISWQADFAKQHGRLPTWSELAIVGFPNSTGFRWPDFMANRKALGVTLGSNRGIVRKIRRKKREAEAIAWQAAFAEKHRKLPTWPELKTRGFPSSMALHWPEFMAERKTLTDVFGTNQGRRERLSGAKTPAEAITWQGEFCEREGRMPTSRELTAAGFRTNGLPKWKALWVERKALRTRFPVNRNFNIGGRFVFLPRLSRGPDGNGKAECPLDQGRARSAPAHKRPCYDRDHLFLAWYQGEGQQTFHSYAVIRAKWNALPRDERHRIAPTSPENITRATLISAVKAAKRDPTS